MNEIEKRVERILNCPLGCAFLLGVEASGLTSKAVAEPENCLRLAAMATDLVRPHSGHNAQSVSEVLEWGSQLEGLARAILEHPATAWWFDPPDLESQLWIYVPSDVNKSWLPPDGAPPGTPNWRRPASPPGGWERYAQKPLGHQTTSTMFGSVSSMLMAYDERVGDYWCSFPLECWELRIRQDVRVYEIHGPESWHELCVKYPAKGTDFEGREDGRLTPDWGAAAEDWDGVHMSLGGLLSCEQTRYESPVGWSKHNFWEAEMTWWLRGLEAAARRLPNHERTDGPTYLTVPVLETEMRAGVPLVQRDGPEPPPLPRL